MSDELAERIDEAKKKMLGNLQPYGGKITLFSKGEVVVKSSDPRVEVRKMA